MSNCKLCAKPSDLRNSHIISEFLYGPTYDHKHRAILQKVSEKKQFIQKGFREKLLCDNCESLLNKWETYFAKFWFELKALPSNLEPNQNYLEIENLDYSQFKLFHLSILWRASVSTRKEFSGVALGPYEEKIRQRLLNSSAGEPDDICVLGSVLYYPVDRSVVTGMVSSPIRIKFDGHFLYEVIFAGCIWYYFLKPVFDPILFDAVLQPNRRLFLAAQGLNQIGTIAKLKGCLNKQRQIST